MLLNKLEIKNFRCIEETSLRLRDSNVLIGENNAGKTSILCALDLAMSHVLTLGENVFEIFDFHLLDENSEPAKAKPIEIKLTFIESEKGEWNEKVRPNLETAIYYDLDEIGNITVKVGGSYDSKSRKFKTNIQFLDLDGNVISGISEFEYLMHLQRMVNFHLLSSLRDAMREFNPNSMLWKEISEKFHLSEEALVEIVADLKSANKRMLSGNDLISKITSHLTKLSDFLPLGREKSVLVEAVPTRPFDLHSRMQFNLASITGAQIPIGKHGSGTQSLAVLLLFEAVIRARMKDDTSKPMQSILALEEPEAHLHKSAEKAFSKILLEISGQKILTTHSDKILSSFSLEDLARLFYQNGKLVCGQLNRELMEKNITDEVFQKMLDKMNRQVLKNKAYLLITRLWFMVEGETEKILLNQCADSMGIDLSSEHVAIVKYSSMSLEFLLMLANQFGYQWYLLGDNDKAGQESANIARKHLNVRRSEDHICLLDYRNMELSLCMHGFGHYYEASATNKESLNVSFDKQKDERYWERVVENQPRGVKVKNAQLVADEIAERGEEAVPEFFKRSLNQVVKLARGAE